MDASFRCGSSSRIAGYEESKLGCVGSILHFLHLHHRFHNQRRMLATTGRRQRKQKEEDEAVVAGTKYSKLERVPTVEEEHGFMTASTTTNHTKEDSSPRATTDTTTPQTKGKDRKKKKKKKGSPPPKQLARTLSIHYLECDDYVEKETNDTTENASNSSESSPGLPEEGAWQKEEPQDNTSAPDEPFCPGSRECLAVKQTGGSTDIELSDPNCNKSFGVHHDPASAFIQDLQMHGAYPVLSRCGSYPTIGNARRTRLSRTASMDTPFLAPKETGSGCGTLHEAKEETSDKSQRTALRHFSSIKTRIKDIIKEEKKEGHRISMDGVLHKIPYGQKPPSDLEVDRSVMDKCVRNNFWHDSAAFSGNRPRIPPQFRRSRSLSDSVERYSYLLESINRESKDDASERFKSTHGDTALMVMNRSKTLGRIYSLRESETNYSTKDDPCAVLHDISLSRRNSCFDAQETASASYFSASREQLSSKKQMNYDIGIFIENKTSRQNTENPDCPSEYQVQPARHAAIKNADDLGELGKTLSETGKHSLHSDKMTDARENANNQPVKASPNSVLATYSDEDPVSPVKFCTSEVRKSIEAEHPTIAEIPDLAETCIGSSIEFPSLSPEDHHVPLVGKNEAEFNYVFNILKKSGFSDEEFLGKWYSPEQPINPSLYVDEIMNPEIDASDSDADMDLYHLLLFDLMNEVLLELSMEPSPYDPWMPCISSHIRSIPFEYNLLPKLWQKISWHLNCQQKQNTELDPVGWNEWMNPKHDMEKIALELDKQILDDLIDELIFGDLLEECILECR